MSFISVGELGVVGRQVMSSTVISQAIIVDERPEEKKSADNIIGLILACNLHPSCQLLLDIFEH